MSELPHVCACACTFVCVGVCVGVCGSVSSKWNVGMCTERQRLPEKLGELLMSTYLFATHHFLNRLQGSPTNEALRWRAYGILAIRMTGTLYIQMDLDNTDCRVQLLYDSDSLLSLSSILDHVVENMKQ